GINLLAAGATRFVLEQVFHSSSNSDRVPGLEGYSVPLLSRIPGGLGDVFGAPLVLLAIGLVVAGQWLLFHSVFGLRLRAVGERPESLATLGLSVGLQR